MKRYKMGVLLLLIMIIPKNVWALNGSLSLTCPSEAKVGETITCSINGSTDGEIYSIDLPFSVTNGTATSFTSSDLWAMEDIISNGKIEQVAKVDANVNGSFSIGTLKIKLTGSAGSDAVLTLSNGSFIDSNYRASTVPTASKSIRIKAESTTPAPTPTKTPTPTPTKTPTATPTKTPTPKPNNNNNSSGNNNNQTPKNNSTTNNNSGSNNNTTTTGNNNANKGTETTNNTTTKKYLSNLVVSNYTIPFDETVYSYDLRINDEDSLEIIPIFDNDKLKYEIIGNENLTNGSVIAVNVTDEDDNKVTYYINIIKENNKSNNIVENEEKKEKGNGSLILIIVAIVLVIINVARLILKSKGGEVKNEE